MPPDNTVDITQQMNQADVRLSSFRQTPNTSFGQQLKTGLATSAIVVNNTANAAAGYSVPGAAVLGAAISGIGSVRDTAGIGSSAMTSVGGPSFASNGLGVGSPSFASSGLGASGTPIGGAGGSSLGSNTSTMTTMMQMQEQSQMFNMQYLQLQENMQAENRDFSVLSNVMKAKSDTAKNTLSNIK